MKKYNWISQELRKKHQFYNISFLVCGAVALACLFFLPEYLKVWNLIPLAVAIVMWSLALGVRSKDGKLGKAKKQ